MLFTKSLPCTMTVQPFQGCHALDVSVLKPYTSGCLKGVVRNRFNSQFGTQQQFLTSLACPIIQLTTYSCKLSLLPRLSYIKNYVYKMPLHCAVSSLCGNHCSWMLSDFKLLLGALKVYTSTLVILHRITHQLVFSLKVKIKSENIPMENMNKQFKFNI